MPLSEQERAVMLDVKSQGGTREDAKEILAQIRGDQQVEAIEEPKDLSFGGSTGGVDLTKTSDTNIIERGKAAIEGIKEAGSGIQERTRELKERETPERSLGAKIADPLNLSSGKLLEGASIAVGGAADIVGSAIGGFIQPEIQKVATTVIENTPEPIKEKVGAAFKKLDEEYEQLPEASKNALFGAGGVLELLVGGTTTKVGKEVAEEAVTKTKNIIRERQETKAIEDALKLETNVKNNIDETISKAIKPRKQFNTDKERVQYENKSRDAVFTIADNKENLSFVDKEGDIVQGELPDSVQQMSDALTQTKKKVFSEYDALAKQTGESGSIVDLSPIVGELQKLKDNVVIQDASPQTASYIDGLIERFGQRESYTPEQAQDIIQNFNDELKAFYRNPSTGQGSRAVVDAMIANKLRVDLDETIESVTGQQYQALKNQYGSLKQIERDVVRAAQRVANKNSAGLVDAMSGLASANQVAQFLTTGGVSNLAQAAATEGVRRYWNMINSPDRAVKNMFKQVDEFSTSRKNQGRFKGTRGAIGKDVNQPLSKSATTQTKLINEAKKFNSADAFIKSKGEPLLHGTTKDFKEFDLSKSGTRNPKDQGFAGKGVYFTNSREVAEDFARGDDIFQTVGKKGTSRVVQAFIDIPEEKILNVFDFDELNKILGLTLVKDKPKDISVIDFTNQQALEIPKKAKSLGYEAIRVDGGGKDKFGTQAFELVVFDDKKIKTKEQLKEIWQQSKAQKPIQ